MVGGGGGGGGGGGVDPIAHATSPIHVGFAVDIVVDGRISLAPGVAALGESPILGADEHSAGVRHMYPVPTPTPAPEHRT